MIFIDRSKVAVPLVFSGKSETMVHYMKEGEAFANDKSIEEPPSLAEILPTEELQDLVLLVTDLFNNKCGYCESIIVDNPVFEEYKNIDQYEEIKAIDQVKQLADKFSAVRCQGESIVDQDEQLAQLFNDLRQQNLGETSHFDISAFRPLSWSKDEYGVTSREHYWWLGNDWNNFHLCCENCCTQKGDRFPVNGQRIKQGQSPDEEEGAMLLDPCLKEDTLNHIAFEGPEAIPLTERGALTIDVYGLNRPRLIDNRAAFLQVAFEKIERYLDENRSTDLLQYNGQLLPSYYPYLACLHTNLAQKFGSEPETLLAVTKVLPGGLEIPAENDSITAEESAAYYQDTLQSKENKEVEELIKSRGLDIKGSNEVHKELLEEVMQQQRQRHSSNYSLDDLDSEEDKKAYFRKSRWISKIEIQNFKNIRELTLEFPSIGGTSKGQEKKQPWLMILGENGVGKSSILQAAAMTLMGQKRLSDMEFNAKEYVTRGEAYKESKVKVYLTDRKTPITLTINKKEGSFLVEPADPQVLLMGYGATRLLTKDKEKELDPDFIRVKNLFDPFVKLDNVQKWLQNTDQVDEGLFEVITSSLLDLMMLKKDEHEFSREKTEKGTWRILFEKEPGNKVPLDFLSDGYKSVIALALDILVGLYQVYGKGEKQTRLKEAEGIALIDEIGVHLHPQWKMWIVGALRRAFPKMNFIVTTHEPLCLRGLEKGEVYVAKLGDDHQLEVITEGLPSPKDLRIDQLLTSSYFGLNSVLDPETEAKYDRYYYLQSLGDELSGELRKEHDRLEQELQDHKLMLGSSLREEIRYRDIEKKYHQLKEDTDQKAKLEDFNETELNELRGLW